MLLDRATDKQQYLHTDIAMCSYTCKLESENTHAWKLFIIYENQEVSQQRKSPTTSNIITINNLLKYDFDNLISNLVCILENLAMI